MKSEGSSASNKFDLIVLVTFPRSGAGTDVMEQINKQAPATIIYVPPIMRNSDALTPRASSRSRQSYREKALIFQYGSYKMLAPVRRNHS